MLTHFVIPSKGKKVNQAKLNSIIRYSTAAQSMFILYVRLFAQIDAIRFDPGKAPKILTFSLFMGKVKSVTLNKAPRFLSRLYREMGKNSVKMAETNIRKMLPTKIHCQTENKNKIITWTCFLPSYSFFRYPLAPRLPPSAQQSLCACLSFLLAVLSFGSKMAFGMLLTLLFKYLVFVSHGFNLFLIYCWNWIWRLSYDERYVLFSFAIYVHTYKTHRTERREANWHLMI